VFTIHPPAAVPRALAIAAYLGAVLAFLLVQEVGLRLRDEEQRAWWAGTGRDLLNAAGLVGLAGTLRLLGLAWPAALLIGGTLTLAMFGASVLVATQLATHHRRAWGFVLGLAIALPVLFFLEVVVAELGALVGALFPEAAPPPRLLR
jgi:hypothetical protein